jgi:nucleoid DNA-binding protein
LVLENEAGNLVGGSLNRAELVEALANRLGDKKSANAALNAVLAEVQTQVAKGQKVAIAGFGVFEKRVRPARAARNPGTGAVIKVQATAVPRFRAGSSFKQMVARGRVPKAATAGRVASPVKWTAMAATQRISAREGAAKTTAAKRQVGQSLGASASLDLEDHLELNMDSIHNLFRAHNLRLTAGADQRLRAMLEQPVAHGIARSNPSRLYTRDASKNLKRLLDEAYTIARAEGRQVIDARTLKEALANICPLPPWC